jgi:hypothetical protein
VTALTQPPGPKPITPQQARIAQLIGDPRNLSYEQIGAILLPPIAERTVKAHVLEMCQEMFDEDTKHAYPPRIQVLVWVKQLQWNFGHMPSIHELIEASIERDV